MDLFAEIKEISIVNILRFLNTTLDNTFNLFLGLILNLIDMFRCSFDFPEVSSEYIPSTFTFIVKAGGFYLCDIRFYF